MQAAKLNVQGRVEAGCDFEVFEIKIFDSNFDNFLDGIEF